MGLAELHEEEVDYERTALTTVVCQLRFNSILRIGKDEPAEFQETIRHLFPVFERREGQVFSFSFGASPAFEQAPALSSYVFKSEDGTWIASLAPDSVSLETSKYVHFADFMAKMRLVKEAAQAEYDIPHYTRAGLRYVNLFKAEEFPGGWANRLNPRLLGPLSDSALTNDILATQQIVRFRDSEESFLNLRHGLNEGGSYLLDLDHALDSRVECDATDGLLQTFNRRIYQAFRWSITQNLHQEMVPHDR